VLEPQRALERGRVELAALDQQFSQSLAGGFRHSVSSFDTVNAGRAPHKEAPHGTTAALVK
jgi:hypothetical protein